MKADADKWWMYDENFIRYVIYMSATLFF